MKRIVDFFEQGNVAPITLAASALVGLMVFMGFVISPPATGPVADMRIVPTQQRTTVDGTFTVEIVVESSIPVNVFAGELNFNPDILRIESIDYNTSVADLWAELPWYSNGDGTLNFAGGTTQNGGFNGTDKLIQVTFRTLQEGQGFITMKKPRILQHDGKGTDAHIKESVDAIVTIESETVKKNNLVAKSDIAAVYEVYKEPPSTDLNADGKQSIADISIFMLNIAGNDERFDFNLDGKVNLKDLNILLGAG